MTDVTEETSFWH